MQYQPLQGEIDDIVAYAWPYESYRTFQIDDGEIDLGTVVINEYFYMFDFYDEVEAEEFAERVVENLGYSVYIRFVKDFHRVYVV